MVKGVPQQNRPTCHAESVFLPRWRTSIPVLLSTVLLVAGCSSLGDADNPSVASPSTDANTPSRRSTAVPTSVGADDEASTSTEPVDTTTSQAQSSAQASDDARSFQELAPLLERLPDVVSAFVGGADAIRIDQLADLACGAVSPGLADTELGRRAVDLYDELAPAERDALGVNEWVLLFGTLIGFFCPELLPDVETSAEADDVTTVEQFRATVGVLDGIPVEADRFIDQLSDDRLTVIQTTACTNTDADMTVEQFGLAITTSYEEDLSSSEREAIDLAAYSETFGAIIGWFCNENLPL